MLFLFLLIDKTVTMSQANRQTTLTQSIQAAL